MHKTKKDIGDFRRGEKLKEGIRIIRKTKRSISIASYYSSGSAEMYDLLVE